MIEETITYKLIKLGESILILLEIFSTENFAKWYTTFGKIATESC